jgi:hypothetical protein
MIIGLDLDNTISDLPEFFSVVAAALVDAGHEVHIITYREPGTDAGVRSELEQLGMRYTRLHLPRRSCSAPEWKAELAADLGLDLMIEDSPEVLARMPDAVQRLWVCDPEVFDLDLCVRALRADPNAPPGAEG